MSETPSAPPPAEPSATPAEDRVMAVIVYGLYLIGPCNGLTGLIGLILAYANLGAAGPKMQSHYIFQIRTFWITVLWAFLGAGVIAIGGTLLIVLIGFPILHLGLAILGLAGVWFFVRSLVGAIYLAQDQAYPRPRSWLI
jgi:uncharacterized membrane protein